MLCLWGCSDDAVPADASDRDGGLSPAPPAPPAEVAPPELPRAEPAPPELGPEPWPSGPLDCGDSEVQVGGACQRLGSACPADGWPASLPAGAVLYVQPGAPPGGDGSRASPFARIADALSAASPGATIALARGRYDEIVRLPSGIAVQGACPAETVLGSSAPSDTDATITLAGTGGALRDLRIAGERPAIIAGAGTAVRLEDVMIVAPRHLGVVVEDGGSVSGSGLVVRDVRNFLADESSGALYAAAGGRVDLDRVWLEHTADAGILAIDESTLVSLRDAVIRDVRMRADGRFGRGAGSGLGATVELTRAVLRDTGGTAILASAGAVHLEDVLIDRSIAGRGMTVQRGGSATLSRVRVRNVSAFGIYVDEASTLSADDLDIRAIAMAADAGDGLVALGGSMVSITRATIDSVARVGLAGQGEGTSLVVSDLLVTGSGQRAVEAQFGASITLARVSVEHDVLGVFGMGDGTILSIEDLTARDHDGALVVQEGATATVTRTLIEQTNAIGVHVSLPGGRLVATDTTIRATGHRGVNVQDGASADFARLSIERPTEVGMAALSPGTELHASDVLIAEVRASPRGFARGLDIEDAATASLERVVVRGADDVGVFLEDAGTTAEIGDLVVEDTLGTGSTGFGHGLDVQLGATLTLRRALLRGNRETAIRVLGADAILRAEDVRIDGTLATAGSGQAGFAVAAMAGAVVEAARVAAAHCHEASVIAAGASTAMRLSDVSIEDTLARECATTTCVGFGAGIGVSSLDGASTSLTKFRIARSALAGGQLVRGGTLDLMTGEISSCPVGVNVQTEGFDFARLTRDVSFRDVERPVESNALPVPQPEMTSIEGAH